MQVTGAKLYVAAVLAVALVLRATIGDSPFGPEAQSTIGWVLNGVAAGLSVIVGPEVMDAVRIAVGKLAGKTDTL